MPASALLGPSRSLTVGLIIDLTIDFTIDLTTGHRPPIHMQLNTSRHARTQEHARTHTYRLTPTHTRTKHTHTQAELGGSSELPEIRVQAEPGERYDDVKDTSELEGGFRTT